MKTKFALPQMTEHGYKYFDHIMVTLGKKTKKQFTDAILMEWKSIASDNHQMMNSGDILRVAESLKIKVDSEIEHPAPELAEVEGVEQD